jgi:hypothetical protein
MQINGHVAISIMVGMCTESNITEAVSNGNSPRLKRSMSIMMHNQEWERWQSFHCLVFGEDVMYSVITDNAIQLGSMLSPVASQIKIAKRGWPSRSDIRVADRVVFSLWPSQ